MRILFALALLVAVAGCRVTVLTPYYYNSGPYYQHYRYEPYPYSQRYHYRPQFLAPYHRHNEHGHRGYRHTFNTFNHH